MSLKDNNGNKFPRAQLYNREHMMKRLKWLSKYTGTKFLHITHFSENPENMRGNIENLIGAVQVPLGIAGPLRINGEYAKGELYIPLATTEGALVSCYQYGMHAVNKAGGIKTTILKDELHLTPFFFLENNEEVNAFISWVKSHFEQIKNEAERTTKHGKLLNIEPIILGRKVLLKFSYFTGDAMGPNMVCKATEASCKFISKETQKKFYLKSNFSSDKKASYHNLLFGYGKMVLAEVTLPREVVIKTLKVTPEDMERANNVYVLSSVRSGMLGANLHFANGIAALFIATGQDAASVANAHCGVSMCECTQAGDLYASASLPNLVVGTVGGGTGLGTQKECLEILGCYGKGKAKKFAEIVGAVALAGDISIGASIVNGRFVEGHEKYGRNRPKENNLNLTKVNGIKK